ncbi:MAG: TIGR03546 family protein [Spirochaetes bacterium]|jgi:uncharacterized protein (TIGR03546 family)|nr:TIGR03546 family protein [Spirochaetota bacterium]
MVINWIAKLIAGLIANRRPGEVGAGIAFGLLLALLPPGNLLWPILFILTFFLRLNLGAELAALGVLRLLVPATDPLLDELGFRILTAPSLTPLWIRLYEIPLLPFTQFNNSLVMGGLIAGAVLWIPVFVLSRIGVMGFRTHVQPKIAESRIVKAFTRVPLVSKFAQALRRFRAAYAAFG